MLGSLLVWTAGLPAAGEEIGIALWRDPAVLRHHLDAACSAVEVVCGMRFGRRPTVRVSTQEDIVHILQSRLEGEMGMLESSPDESRRFLAYYDPMEHEIHILPNALAEVSKLFQSPELLGENVLRAVLVHEATHALDFQRFPLRWTRRTLACCAASDERLATEAVLEGHAQLVTEEVARLWGIEDAFQRITHLYTGVSVGSDAPRFVGFDQDAAFVYLQGEAFMRTVQTARGRAGVGDVLRDPPFETRVIDRPVLWLRPELRGEEVDLKAVLEVFRPLIPEIDWEMSKWRVLGPALPMFPDERSKGTGVVESYLDNHGLYAGTRGGNHYINVFLAYCRSERDAERFVRALRGVDKARDSDPAWEPAARREGAGTAGHLPGFASRRRAVGGAPASALALHVARQGRYVIELTTYGLAAGDRSAQDRAIDLAARLLRSSPPTATAVALRSSVKEFLAVRSVGRMDEARILMRDLLPSAADLRRTVRPEYALAFADRYTGTRLELRTTRVPNATVESAFGEAGPRAVVRAWAATTEQLAAGTGRADLFPPEIQTFCRKMSAPGTTWVVLVVAAEDGTDERTYACFARLGDRFVWIKDPWMVLGGG